MSPSKRKEQEQAKEKEEQCFLKKLSRFYFSLVLQISPVCFIEFDVRTSLAKFRRRGNMVVQMVQNSTFHTRPELVELLYFHATFHIFMQQSFYIFMHNFIFACNVLIF